MQTLVWKSGKSPSTAGVGELAQEKWRVPVNLYAVLSSFCSFSTSSKSTCPVTPTSFVFSCNVSFPIYLDKWDILIPFIKKREWKTFLDQAWKRISHFTSIELSLCISISNMFLGCRYHWAMLNSNSGWLVIFLTKFYIPSSPITWFHLSYSKAGVTAQDLLFLLFRSPACNIPLVPS